MPYISTINDKVYTIDTGENKHQRAISIFSTNSPHQRGEASATSQSAAMVGEATTLSIDWRQVASLAADAKGQSDEGGQYSLIITGKSYQVFARRLDKPEEKGGSAYEIQVAGQRFEVRVEDERERALTGSIISPHEAGEAMVRAPMPGLVLGLPLQVGATVARGQTVAILEAMKMENDLSSPIAGTIKEVRASQGQTVNQGDVLVVISAHKE